MVKKHLSLPLLFLIAIFFFLSFNIPISKAHEENNTSKYTKYVHGQVIKIIAQEFQKESNIVRQEVLVKITSGEYKNKDVIIVNTAYNSSWNKIIVKPSDRVLLWTTWTRGEFVDGYIKDFNRGTYLLYLTIFFFALLAIIGGKKGIKSIATLVLTGVVIIKIFIPLIIRGYSPLVVSVSVSVAITLFTLIIIGGINHKTISAIIGTTGGIALAGTITLIVGNLSKLNGVHTEGVEMLKYHPIGSLLDFEGLLFAGIILGALGATMDVSISVASAMEEIELSNPRIKVNKLIRSGMNVGKDIMGTMSNTLVLAYIGSAAPLLILFYLYEGSFQVFINSNTIATEVIRAMAGSIGLIFTIPITAITRGMLKKR